MANYNIYIEQTGGPKTAPTLDVEYPENVTTGTGHSSGSPLELNVGDTLTFQNADTSLGAGATIISSLNIFTDNTDISLLTNTASTFAVTVASGGLTADTITFNKTTNAGTATEQFFYVERQAGITPPVISSVTNNNASSASVTTTVNLSSNGSGGTLEYAQATTNSIPATGWQTGNTFSHPRGTTRYYWASQDQDTAGASDSSGAIAIGYIAPDTSVSASNVTITASATSASIVIRNATSGERYQLRNQTGTLQYQSASATSASVTVVQTSGLPNVDSTVQYQIYARRPTGLGGDGLYDATGDTYQITRSASAVNISAPTASNVTVNDPDSSTYTATFNLSNAGSGGTLQYAIEKNDSTPDNWTDASTDSQTTFTADFTRTATPGTIYAQARRSVSDTSSIVSVAGRGIIAPATISCSNQTISNTATGPLAVAITGGIQTHEAYYVSETTGLASANVIANSIDGINPYDGSDFSIPDGNLPTVAQSPKSFYLYSARFGSSGGDGAFDEVGSFTITREAPGGSAPTISDVTNNNAAASSVTVTVSLSDNGSGGDGLFYGRASTSNSDNVSSWQSGNTFSQSRSSNFYYFASRSSDTGASNTLASSGVLEAVPFLTPDSSISAENVTISGSSNETASITVNGTTSGETISIRANSAPYTIIYATQVASSSTTVIPLTTNLPTQGNTTTYRLTAIRPESLGGDGLFDLGDTFTVTRAADSAPTFTVTSNCAAAASVGLTFNISDEGSGGDGNLYYVADLTNGITPPPFGWSTTQPSTQSRGTTVKYWVSRVSNGSSLTSSFPLESGYIPPDVDVGLTPTSKTLSSSIASTTFNILNTTQHHIYRVFDTQQNIDVSNSSAGGTLTVTIPLTGVQDGDVIDAEVTATLATSRGGDGLPDDANTNSSIVINIVDEQVVPSLFSFTDVGSASVGQIYDTFVQIVGTGGSTLTASSVSGTATFAVSTTSTTPGSGFSQTSKSIDESEYLHVRMQASSSANTTVESTIEVGDREDDWRITTGALPSVLYSTEWYSDNSSSTFTVTSLSSDIVTGRGSNAAVNCQTMLPGDQLAITVSNGPSSESANLYLMFSEIGGRFENQFTDVKVDVGETYTVTVADTFTGSCFLRLISELNYTTNVLPTSSLVNSTGYIPIHMKMPVVTQDYGMQIYAPNGTLLAIDENTNVASLETTYATSVTLAAGSSTTLSNPDIGDYGAVEYIIPGGVNTESLSGTVALQVESTSASGLKITNTGTTTLSNLDFQFIRIF